MTMQLTSNATAVFIAFHAASDSIQHGYYIIAGNLSHLQQKKFKQEGGG